MSNKTIGRWVSLGVVLVIAIIGSGMWGCPKYRVYSQQLRGEAALREAEFDRQIRVQEAEADLDAARLDSQAEAERARGAREAIDIVEQGLTPAYLHYLWVQGLHDGSSEVIYVPTEANLPILEATRTAAGFRELVAR